MNNKSIVWRDEAVAAIAASFNPSAERVKEVIMDAQLAVMGLPEAVPEKKQSKEPDMIGGMRRCPFCGAFPTLDGSDNVNGQPFYYITCPKCGGSQFGKRTKEEAIEQWNRRQTDAP